MKQIFINRWLGYLIYASTIVTVLFCLLGIPKGRAESNKTDGSSVSVADIIASVHEGDIYFFESVANKCKANRKLLGEKLIEMLTDKKSSNLSQCTAAYYLGEMRYAEASESLSSKITLTLDMSMIQLNRFPKFESDWDNAAVEALIKIGSPCIPAVMKNLADSDDAKVRSISLKVLYRIDGDRDIVQLHLQKALDAQLDPQKKARLQSAQQALLNPKFGK